ncbi:rhodanese-like domain-containing protein [Lignipirellula cremea]|uniref:Putative adenylyltransferase/sulfurtransferase MoeZ n=1 Tax=Lignipirellula cremea TaxID=2528010 RepID=A0A518E2W7_9BACT|nr:rhodanese-like domain-containing protein [Lignipirellula cremea]QDU98402.1 putative adenylyltransferase/sulfurtransferase MoeZ [Lignipirellula cremea]
MSQNASAKHFLPLWLRRCRFLPLWGGLLAMLGGCREPDRLQWDEVKQMVRTRFPGVQQLSTEQLAAWQADEERPQPVLLDTRTPEEYAVSHLQGAVLAPDLESALQALGEAPVSTPIVAYCSVGYRSSQLAEELQQHGYGNTFNLEGSLFQWANEHRPLYQNERRVEQAHPYDARWGVLLEAELHADTPKQATSP